MALTNAAGTLVERYTYSAYGTLGIYAANGTVRTSSTYANRYTYTGREWDADLKLYHFQARWYDPTTGGFISRDPLGYVDGMSLYRGYFGVIGLDPIGAFLITWADDWHHILPWKWQHYFREAGIDINSSKWGVMLEKGIHQDQINGKCGKFWDQFFNKYQRAGTLPSREEILAQLSSKEHLDLEHLYNRYGTPATVPYKPCETRPLSVATCQYYGLPNESKLGKLPPCQFVDVPSCPIHDMKCKMQRERRQRGLPPNRGGDAQIDVLESVLLLLGGISTTCAIVDINDTSRCSAERDNFEGALRNLRLFGGSDRCVEFNRTLLAFKNCMGIADPPGITLIQQRIELQCLNFPKLTPVGNGGPPPKGGPAGAEATVDH